MKKVFSIIVISFVFFLTGSLSYGQESISRNPGFWAQGGLSEIYYLIDPGQSDADEFSVYYAQSSDPARSLYLGSYLGRPSIGTVHDGSVVVFFDNGTVLGYSVQGGITYQNFDRGYEPLDAISFGGELYLLASGADEYAVFKLAGKKWVPVLTAPVSSESDLMADARIFSYNDSLYLAGVNRLGKLLCGQVVEGAVAYKELTVGGESDIEYGLADVITANRSVVFILSQDNPGSMEYYASVFANDLLGSRVRIETDVLPLVTPDNCAFLGCDSDLALAVYADNLISVQKYELDGARVGDVAVSYNMGVSDVSENMYVQIAALVGPAIVVLTTILCFRRSMTVGSLPVNPSGVPSPLGLRFPAFVVDFILMLFVVESLMKVLNMLGVIDLEQLLFTMQNLPNPFEMTGKVNIDVNFLLLFYVLIYAVMIVYFSLFEWLLSATPGKMLFGLKVVDSRTLAVNRISFWRILLRNVYRIFELVPYIFPLTLILIIISPRKQRSGDMVANTSVVLTRVVKKGTNIDHMA
ncbi:MAG: RDD family protein [Sedimentisphaerales bacterium]|nr:RDD family protein [Sedimentisphaerales bacterium]MBN2842670.1 RDD family protein [Sedimentisphaerales bacterium]